MPKCMGERAESPVVIARPPPGSIPTSPGSYQFKDEHGRILYVGKARNLRSRVSNYFGTTTPLQARTIAMLDQAHTVDWVETDTEVEAFFLEYNLIKQHRPRYNVRLKDDKSYPWLAITLDEQWPRPHVMRGSKRKGVRYFGPYAHAYAIRETLDLLLRTLPVRTCSNAKFHRHERDGRPCLLAHIEKCSAPCVGAISEPEYANLVEDLMRFLDGDHDGVLARLAAAMTEASDQLEFEKAARLRDQLESVRRVSERQEMVGDPRTHFDVVAIAADDLEAQVQVLHVRKGRVVGTDGFGLERGAETTDADLAEAALFELTLRETNRLPVTICMNGLPENLPQVEAALSKSREGRLRLHQPQRGTRKRLVDLAERNARERLARTKLRRAADPNARAHALRSLQDALGLTRAPLRIECFDISHLAGTDIVASMVVMEDGLMRRPAYRRFRIQGLDDQDDFASMEQVISRRLQRELVRKSEPTEKRSRFAYPPDLLVVDGGLGQLHAAQKAIEHSGVTVGVVSLAKRLEEIYVPGHREPVRLERDDPALYLLQQLRDEAHRFAITFQRQSRAARTTASLLDGVPGLGPTRRNRLLREYGSVKALRTRSEPELAAISWLPASVARALFDTLHADLRR